MLLFQQGRVEEARQVLRQGVAANPANPQLCMEWALAEEAAGNLGEAYRAAWVPWMLWWEAAGKRSEPERGGRG